MGKINFWDALYLRNRKGLLDTIRDTARPNGAERPMIESRMLVRDFINHSLYHPETGYFTKNVSIFQPPAITFSELRNNFAFMNHLGSLYAERESEVHDGPRQLWHTPSELFKPWYGNAVAKYILREYRRDSRGARRLEIFEVGGGNGTLMRNVMEYIQLHEPEIFKTMRYTIVEISPALARSQQSAIGGGSFREKVSIVDKSIFSWTEPVHSPCFFLAMEVIDNFPHDMLRYDYITGQPRQGVVLTDADGNYSEAYESLTDPLIQNFLEVRRQANLKSRVLGHPIARQLRSSLLFAPNMTEREFIPTACLQFLEKLRDCFPNHRLILSDFSSLPDAISGHCAPVVQTRYNGAMVECSTFMVQPGYFDIFFPTDFSALRSLYEVIFPGRANCSTIMTHNDFLQSHADLQGTTTKSGENPLLEFYKNFSFILT